MLMLLDVLELKSRRIVPVTWDMIHSGYWRLSRITHALGEDFAANCCLFLPNSLRVHLNTSRKLLLRAFATSETTWHYL